MGFSSLIGLYAPGKWGGLIPLVLSQLPAPDRLTGLELDTPSLGVPERAPPGSVYVCVLLIVPGSLILPLS